MPQDDSDNEYEREENMMENITKTYLVTDTLITKLPVDFVFSTNKRYIEIQNCKVVDLVHNNAPNNVCMHINLLHDRQYLDNNVGFVNFIKTKYKRYEVKGNEEELIIWFTQERGAPSRVFNPVIHNFPDRRYPRFSAFNYADTPNFDDIEIIFDFLKVFFTADIRRQYGDTTQVYNIHNAVSADKDPFAGKAYEAIMAPLFADETFYDRDFLVDKLDQIVEWVVLLQDNNIMTPAVECFVRFFLLHFKSVMTYSYVRNFDTMPNMNTLGVCLAAYIYNNVDDYTTDNGVLKALSNSVNDFTMEDADSKFDFVMFTECMFFYNDKYGMVLTELDDVMFTWYWTMVDEYAQKFNLDRSTLYELASTLDTIPDFSRANIDVLLTIIGRQPTDFTVNFSNAVNNDSLSYLFIELCNLMAGHYSTELLNWHEYSATTAPGLTTAIEITFDPFYPEWWLEREVEYRDANPFPEEQYVVNALTGDYEAQYRFMAEFMLIF